MAGPKRSEQYPEVQYGLIEDKRTAVGVVSKFSGARRLGVQTEAKQVRRVRRERRENDRIGGCVMGSDGVIDELTMGGGSESESRVRERRSRAGIAGRISEDSIIGYE